MRRAVHEDLAHDCRSNDRVFKLRRMTLTLEQNGLRLSVSRDEPVHPSRCGARRNELVLITPNKPSFGTNLIEFLLNEVILAHAFSEK